MSIKQILTRIERRLAATGQSADAASRDAGHKDMIRNMKRGKVQTVKLAPMHNLAKQLRTTALWLMEEIGPEEPEIDRHMIPVRGQVGAGGVVIPANDGDIGEIEAPPNSGSKTAAVEIIGESLGRLFDGWYAIYDDARDPPTDDLIGELCVLQLSDGRSYIKKLTKGQGKRFTLESNFEAPIVNVVVTWAAKVKTLVPR